MKNEGRLIEQILVPRFEIVENPFTFDKVFIIRHLMN